MGYLQTNTLHKAARQLKRKQPVVLQALLNDQTLRSALLLSDLSPPLALHAWVVDTSIEFDGEVVDGFYVVSREVMEIALRDEQHYLREFGQIDEAKVGSAVETLYADGFSAQAFAQLIESNEIWSDVF
ncbi:hypothetical protein RYR28_002508 [Edwardsiella piscicida]|uniref:hypothetical protein n=1 Tax=Edwardsiella piscicida TaxID=1263550 RepID=UPI00290AB462|nr:hypothetical protein [Edwardsiella piscicida]